MQKKYEGIKDCHYRVSAKAFIRNDQGKFLLCLSDSGYWDVPGGGIDHGEEIHDALKREIKEEMGINTTYISSHPLYVYLTESTTTKLPICILNYSAKIEHYDFTPSDECREIGFFNSEEAKNIKLYSPNQKVMKEIEKQEA